MELMLGNEAVARGAWEAGARVAAAYPGTPSTEIMEYLAKYEDVYTEWSANEKVALEVAMGASLGGARTLCCMKHVGLNVAADPLFTVAYSGISGGLVLAVADDPGMFSSQNEQDSRYYARSAHVPMLEPSNSAECLAMTKQAFEISEEYDTPVMLRLVTRIAHARSLVQVNQRQEVQLKEYVKNPQKYVMMPGHTQARHVFVEARELKMLREMKNLNLNHVEMADTSVGVVCAGSSYNYVKEAMPNASVLKLGMVYPLDEEAIRLFAATVDTLYVVEELEPFIEDAIKAMGLFASGKDKTGLQGELSALRVAHLFSGGKDPGALNTPEAPKRPPVLCPGCPHRALFGVIKKLKLHVSGDIGCYTLGALPPLNALDSQLCMGASIGMALGLEKAIGRDFSKKAIALLGDSTFIHSGITGLVNAVYNRGNITVVIADNSITGMTGHQQNPTTGLDIHGQAAPQVSIEKLCEAAGAQSVRVVDPFDLKLLTTMLKEETAKDGVSVIIARRPCILLLTKKESAYQVQKEKCINCGVCRVPGCPALQQGDGHVYIDEALCNSCGQCAQACPKHAIGKGETVCKP